MTLSSLRPGSAPSLAQAFCGQGQYLYYLSVSYSAVHVRAEDADEIERVIRALDVVHADSRVERAVHLLCGLKRARWRSTVRMLLRGRMPGGLDADLQALLGAIILHERGDHRGAQMTWRRIAEHADPQTLAHRSATCWLGRQTDTSASSTK